MQRSAPSDSKSPNIPLPPPADAGGSDSDSLSLARKEDAYLKTALDSLDSWAANNKIRRDEYLRNTFFLGVRILVLLTVFLFGATMSVFVWHLIGPHDYRWLTPTEIEKVQVLVFSGAVSSLATVIGKRIFGQDGNGSR